MDQHFLIEMDEKKYTLLTKVCHMKKKVLADAVRCKEKYQNQTNDFYNGCSTVYSSQLSGLDEICMEIENVFKFSE